MTSLHGMSLDTYADGEAAGSVALGLSEAPISGQVLVFTNEGWEVEIRPGAGPAETYLIFAGRPVGQPPVYGHHFRVVVVRPIESGSH